jgi:predicted O-linked N-acetylglucosamine transferase (SPINDLY family)
LAEATGEAGAAESPSGTATAAAADPLNRLSALIAQAQSGSPEARAAAASQLREFVGEYPAMGAAHMGLGIAVALQGNFGEARLHFEKSVVADPKLASAWSNLGNIEKLQGRYKEAKEAYHRAIALQPSLSDAHYNLALVLDLQGLAKESEASLRRALLFRPDYPEVHNNLGHMLLKAGKVEQALSHFRQALVFDPSLQPARHNLIFALYRLGRSTEAQAEVDGLLAQSPDDARVLRVQAAGLAQQGRLGDAEAINRKLLEMEPDAPDLQMNLGEVMLQRDDYEGALACYRELLAKGNVLPAMAIGAMANVMQAQGNHSEARNLYQQALMLASHQPNLLLGLTRALLDAGETRQGIETLKRSVELLPLAPEVQSLYLLAMRLDGQASAADRHALMQEWQMAHASKTPASLGRRNRKAGDALRVGLLVGQLEAGAAGLALAALLPLVDPKRLDITVYHAGRAGPAAVDLQALAPHWRPVAALGHSDITEQMRQDQQDVMVDMVGHEVGSRLLALSEGVAPVQLRWLGDFEPSGLPGWSGMLQDAVLAGTGGAGDAQVAANAANAASADRPEADGQAAEMTALVLPALAPWSAPADAPECGPLPMTQAGHVTFGVASPISHIQPAALDAWASVLEAVPTARLLILTSTAAADEATRSRLQRQLLLRDVEAERVDILPRISANERLQALARMDVVLDTFPSPWGLDALGALWMGVPVLTLQGAERWQRTTQSALVQAELADDWTAPTVAAYVEKAIAVAAQPDGLAALRQNLRATLRAAALMDHAAFARAFEAALLAAWETGGRQPSVGWV